MHPRDVLQCVLASPFLPKGDMALAERVTEQLLTDVEYRRAYEESQRLQAAVPAMVMIVDARVKGAVEPSPGNRGGFSGGMP